jgi:hypothetical protein
MKSISLFAVMLLVAGCTPEANEDHSQTHQVEVPAYPGKVTALIKLIEQLEPGTNVQEWVQLVDRTIMLPDEDVLLSGGSGMGESWQTFGIGAGDEWALSIESYQHNGEIWEAMVVRTSISKRLANEPCETEKIYPHFYKGNLVGSKEEKLQLRNKRTESGNQE